MDPLAVLLPMAFDPGVRRSESSTKGLMTILQIRLRQNLSSHGFDMFKKKLGQAYFELLVTENKSGVSKTEESFVDSRNTLYAEMIFEPSF